MSLLTRAGQVTKAYKNVGRVREIVATMTRFGFGTLVNQIGFKKFKESAREDHKAKLALPVRIRLLFEELGPTFIKLGQILAGRPDLVPAEIVVELEKLQDQVAPVPFNDLRSVLEDSLGKPLSDCFSSFDTEALATASIAQVHSARTLNGDEVVVKIKKPGVGKLITQDLEILETIAYLFERYIPELRPFKPSLIVQEIHKSIQMELDFHREAIHMRRFRHNFKDSTFLVVPKPYPELSSENVLTMEKLKGIKLQHVEEVKKIGVDPSSIMQQGMEIFFQSILVDGLFHGDPHGGNILVLFDGRMGLLDFGSVGWLSKRSKDALINMFLALLAEDYQGLVTEYLSISPAQGNNRSSTVTQKIQAEVSKLFTPYFGLPIKEIPIGRLLLEGTSIALKYNIVVPTDLILVFKSIMTLEGIGRSLDPDFDLVSAGTKYAKIALKQRYAPDRIAKELLFAAKSWGNLLESAPKQISEILRQTESGEISVRIESSGLKELARSQREASTRVSLSILSAALFIGSLISISIPLAIPLWLQTTLFSLTTFLFFWVLWRLLKK